MARVLTTHADIRDWVTARGGQPLLQTLPNGSGEQSLLQLTFGQHALDADRNEGPDPIGGFDLVGWDEWLATLDDQKLALKVNEDVPGALDNAYEFVAREPG